MAYYSAKAAPTESSKLHWKKKKSKDRSRGGLCLLGVRTERCAADSPWLLPLAPLQYSGLRDGPLDFFFLSLRSVRSEKAAMEATELLVVVLVEVVVTCSCTMCFSSSKSSLPPSTKSRPRPLWLLAIKHEHKRSLPFQGQTRPKKNLEWSLQ